MLFTPFDYQRRVADLLLAGQNVILQAPTGAGKTYAALLPFIEAQEHHWDFPKQCIYAVPMRTLANQFVVSELGLAQEAAILTGEHPDDVALSHSLVFATIDQVLSSFLMTPYSLSRSMANVNAGAIASSYLVLDEFHLYDPQEMLPTAIEMLRILRGVAPFLLMTATFSHDMLHGLADALHAVVVPETSTAASALAALPSQQKTRRYHVAEQPLDAREVLAKHQRRSLVICNTVERAQRLFLELKADAGRYDEVLLLHSRFLPADRAVIEERLRTSFGRDAATEKSCIAVATQAIEVGLDITCDTLHTELAPANAILQRAGRCARYKGEVGDVYVYPTSAADPAQIVDLQDKAAPYASQRQEIAATLTELRARDGQALAFQDEQNLITAVHGRQDQQTIYALGANREGHRHLMNVCWRTAKGAGKLIRMVATQPVIIHNDPLSVAMRPYAHDRFALHIGVVRGLVKQWLARSAGTTDNSALWALHEITAEGAESPQWDVRPVHSERDAETALAIIVHPALARYDADLGFWPYEGGTWIGGAKPISAKERARYRYHLEPWLDHARLVWQAQRDIWPRLERAARCLEARAQWPSGTLARLADLIALLHDVGKLSSGWQDWVRTYQAAIGRPIAAGCYAHTDSDPANPAHGAAARAAGSRPPHAVESAVATAPLLQHYVADDQHLLEAVFSTIARHHSALAHQLSTFELVSCARELVCEALLVADITEPLPDRLCERADATILQREVEQLLFDPDQDDELVAYMLLARALRLADQGATGAASALYREQEEEAM